MPTQMPRTEDMLDLFGKAAYLDFDQRSNAVHNMLQTQAPDRFSKPTDRTLQHIFGIVDLGQKLLCDEHAIVPKGYPQCHTLVVELIEYHCDRDGVRRDGDVGGILAARGRRGETDQLPACL